MSDETTAVILNGGEQTIDGVTTGFLYGQDAETRYINRLLDNPDMVQYVPFEQVSIEEGFNARNFATKANQEHVKEIAESIATRGVETPITVRIEGNRIIVVDGEVRTRATYLANDNGRKVEFIPVLLSTEENAASRVETLITKNSGNPLTMTEQVAVVNRLINKYGYTKTQVLENLGFSRTMFSKLMILAEAPADVFEAASQGKITPTAVVQLMTSHRESPPEEISKIVNKAVKKAEKDAEEAKAEGKTEKTGASSKATATDIQAVLAEDEEDVKAPIYNKTTFNGALQLLFAAHSLLENRVKDQERLDFRQGIENYLESINVNIGEPLPEARKPLTEEEKAEREKAKAEAKAAKEAEKEAERAKKAEALAKIEEAKRLVEEAKLAAGIKPRAKKEKAEGEATADPQEVPVTV